MGDETAEKKYLAELDFKTKGAGNKLDELLTQLEDLSTESEKSFNSISSKFNSTINKLNTSNTKIDLNFMNSKEMVTAIQNITKQYNLTASQTKKLSMDVSRIVMQQQKKVNEAAIENSQKEYQSIVKKYEKEELEAIKTAGNLQRLADNVAAYKEKKDYAAIISERKKQQQLTQEAKLGISDRIAAMAKTYVTYQGFNQLKQIAADTVEAMKSVEYRMMEISRIMGDGTIDVNKYRDSLTNLAFEYGRSFDEVSTVTLNFARAGYDANDALALTEKSLLALNTAELDAGQATDGLISVMAQWGMDSGTTAEKSENLASVIDKINKTADKFPITSEDLLEALKRTSQGFNLAGASIDETIAMIVAAERASQRGGKVIGTAMANITQQLKAEGKETLAESLGLSLFEDEAKTTYKSVTEIFAQMSERMAQLKKEGKESSSEMQQLLEMFTVFRRNIGAGLLSEMSGEESTYVKALKNSQKALGYSIQENSKYMNTMEAASKQLDATILQLQNTLADEGGRGIFTSFVLGAEAGVNIINTLIKSFGALPVAISTVVMALGLLNKKMNLQGIKNSINVFKQYSDAIKMFNSVQKEGKVSAEQFNKAFGKDLPESLKKYISGLDGAEGSLSGYITKTAMAKIGTMALQVTVAAFEAAISFGLTFALQFCIESLMNWINATEKAGESLADMNANIKESEDSLNEYAVKYENLIKEIESGSLTQEEANKKRRELSTIQDELKKKYGDEADSIDLVNGKLDEQIKKINDLSKIDYEKYLQENLGNIDKIVKEFTTSKKETVDLNLGIDARKIDNDITKIIEDLGGKIDKHTQDLTGSYLLAGFEGTPDKILENYRELFNKLQEYSKNLSEEDAKLVNIFSTSVSNKISSLEKKYGENYQTYQKFLENRLKLDSQYSGSYAKILEARANLEKAIAKGNEKEIQQAKEKLSTVYSDAIKIAEQDKTASKGMTEMLNNQLTEAQKEADKDTIKVKMETKLENKDGKSLKEQIQEMLNEMGEDFTFEDLKIELESEETTEKIQNLKGKLDEAGISVKDFIDNFEFLGFSLSSTAPKAQEVTDNLEAINKSVQDALQSLVDLESGFTSVYNAMNEFNENGYISASTLQNLINNNLLQYFDVVDGKLAISEAAMANAANSAKVLAVQQLAVQAAADIMAIAEGNAAGATDSQKQAAENASSKSKALGDAFLALGQDAITGADGVKKMWAAVENAADVKGFSDNMKNQITSVLEGFQKSVIAINTLAVSPVSYNRVSARGSGGSGSSSRRDTSVEDTAKAEEKALKEYVSMFEKTIDEREKLEDRWVKNKKKLGLISDEDEKYILQQSIKRYKTYVEEVNQLTYASEEEKTRLRKKYGEIAEDLEIEYFDLLKDLLEDQIKAIEDKYKEDADAYKDSASEKIDKIKDVAKAEIDALKEVEEENDRIRQKEEYEANRKELVHGYQGVEYWKQRTGREAQLALAEAQKKVDDLDKNWQETVDKWNVEDQIKLIEERRDADIAATEAERDAYLKALEETKNAEIQALRDKYQYQLDYFNQTGKIIEDGATIQSEKMFKIYKEKFIDPVGEELREALNTYNEYKSSSAAAGSGGGGSTTNYTIQYGDTLGGIAARYGTTIDKIMEQNPDIVDRNIIYAGRQLRIPTSHTGSRILEDGLVNLQAGEIVLKQDWARGLDRMLGDYGKSSNTNNITNGSTINVDGDLIKVEANIEDKTDATFLTKRITRELENKFNIKR